MIDADTFTYWYAIGLVFLLNMLATGIYVVSVEPTDGYLLVPVSVVCNLAGYAAVLSYGTRSRAVRTAP